MRGKAATFAWRSQEDAKRSPTSAGATPGAAIPEEVAPTPQKGKKKGKKGKKAKKGGPAVAAPPDPGVEAALAILEQAKLKKPGAKPRTSSGELMRASLVIQSATSYHVAPC